MTEYIVNAEEERLFYGDKYEELVRCKNCRHQVHCHQTVSHTKIHDGFKEYWSEPIEWCSRGERREE